MKSPILLIALVVMFAGSAQAGSSMAMDLKVPVSGSIAMPSAATATFTNPAGLVGNNSARLSLQAGSPDPMNDPNYRALLLVGNGMFGASAGVDYAMRSGSADDSGWAVYGLAVNVSALNLSLGISGRTGIKSADGTDFNVGLLLQPTQFVTVGALAKGVKGSPDNYGVGVGFELVNGVDLVADAGFNSEFKNGEFKPGLKVSNSYAGLSLSYGTGSTAFFADAFSSSAYLRVGANSELEFSYNHGGDLPKYYAALSFGF